MTRTVSLVIYDDSSAKAAVSFVLDKIPGIKLQTASFDGPTDHVTFTFCTASRRYKVPTTVEFITMTPDDLEQYVRHLIAYHETPASWREAPPVIHRDTLGDAVRRELAMYDGDSGW